MSIEQALEELKKYAQEFSKVGDAKQAIASNKDEFLHKWAKVNQYYKYIMNNTKAMSDEWFMAIDIISDISMDNPSLEEWIEKIVEPKQEKTKTQSQNNVTMDASAISSQIESIVSEVKNMHSWDPDYIGDIEWQLQEYKKMLQSYQSSLDKNAYQNLMNEINISLNKIGKFNNMLNSETMEDIKRR